jgi:hypothetical protein
MNCLLFPGILLALKGRHVISPGQSPGYGSKRLTTLQGLNISTINTMNNEIFLKGSAPASSAGQEQQYYIEMLLPPPKRKSYRTTALFLLSLR